MSSRDRISSRIRQGWLKKHVQKIAMRVQDRLRLRSEAHRRDPRRLGEADQVGRDGHAHVVPSAHQFAADREVGLDVAATSPAGQHKFHRGSRPFRRKFAVFTLRGMRCSRRGIRLDTGAA